MKKAVITLAAMALTTALAASPASAAESGSRPDIDCMRAGMGVLKEAGLFSAVAMGGLPIETAVAVGVTVRSGADISGVPNPIPLSVVLADHRAGDNSLFVYPWCS
ncbi:hypothetical protein [Propioniciclava sinopodophylli]|uniref:hypothetical protein n=1 Tax=Propioniciclava sinopodophylli TaxID=1837344 RepID=UPI002492A28F|nr:hypothetical protein [Propioniciclava sinopodophylli]